MRQTIHQAQDKLAWEAFKDIRVVQEIIREYLPPELATEIDLNNLRPYTTKLVSVGRRKLEADMVYEMQLQKKETAFLLLHAEHFSKAERDAPLRIWQYIISLLQDYRSRYPKRPLPPVYSVMMRKRKL